MSTPSTSGEGRGSGGSSGSPSVGGQTRRVHWDPEAEPHQSSRAEGWGGAKVLEMMSRETLTAAQSVGVETFTNEF